MYESELEFLKDLLKKAGKQALVKPGEILQKAEFDLVTDIDKSVEKTVLDAIAARYPADNILSEETRSSQKVEGRTWTVDPVDGTCNMAHGLPLYGVQISLIDNGEIVVAGIYHPHFDELFTATKNGGTYLNGKRIFVSGENAVGNAIVGFGDYTHKRPEYAKNEHKAIAILYDEIAKVRFFGAACVDFAYVASGRLDGYYIRTKNMWDMAPGILLCVEAGAVVTDRFGNPYTTNSDSVIVAANKKISDVLIKAFKE